MKACNRSAVRVSAWCLAALGAAFFATAALAQSASSSSEPAATTQPATAPALLPKNLPPADSFQAMNKPGGDGSTVIVQWGKPTNELPGTLYVLEAAKSPEDFGARKAKPIVVRPREKSLAKSNREVFGYGKETDNIYYAELSEAGLFRPEPPQPHDTPEGLKKLVDDKVISEDQDQCVQRVLPNQKALEVVRDALSPAQIAVAVYQNMLIGALAKGDLSAQDIETLQKAQDALGKAQDGLTDAPIALDNAWDGWGDPKQAFKVAANAVNALQDTIRHIEKDMSGVSLPASHASVLENCQAALAQAKEAVAKATLTLPDCSEKDLRWYHYLREYLAKLDGKAMEQEVRKGNQQTLYFRLSTRLTKEVGGRSVPLAEANVLQDGQPKVVSAASSPGFFKMYKLNNLIFSLVFLAIVFVFIQVAKRNPNLFIRKISGLEAVDEAIGRSTEMDKPIFFVHGLGDMSDLATIASVNILGRVAQRAAEHDTRVRVMNNDPIVTAVSQEVVQQAYRSAGRPDAYNPDDVSLVASDQFSYVAAVSGRMAREEPGAIFILGSFAAESLLLAENGAATGAIQVAGTDAFTQLPFFITTCDYTLIGEELYAASAYLSREPRLLGSLRGQDVGKAFLMAVIVLVPIVLTIAKWQDWDFGWLWGFLSGGKG